ncbi:MAG TPA: Fe-S protein assembly co-chaperone HscB [Methylomirabilota bacterium]|nr:Fe-S protein assembly co-chaperone HscB [Methylomirabilota bacterium]
MNFFEVFGLPRRLAIDVDELQRRFYALARQTHPDFHQAAPPAERVAAEERAAVVNAAYRTLRDPLTRAEYLVRLEEGRTTREGGEARPAAPASLLAEMFEIQEALAEAKAGPLDEAGRAALAAQRDALQHRYAQEIDRVRGALAARWDAATGAERPAALVALKDALATLAYLRTVITDLSDALGEEASGVAHHRH